MGDAPTCGPQESASSLLDTEVTRILPLSAAPRWLAPMSLVVQPCYSKEIPPSTLRGS